MKLKPIIGIVLVVGLATGIWLWTHRQAQPQNSSVARPVKPARPAAASPPPLVPVNTPKMAAVTTKPAGQRLARVFVPTGSNWEVVHKIVDARLGYEDRVNAINALSAHLTDSDWALLKRFLLKPDSLDQTQLGQVIKNRLLDALCAQQPPPGDLGNVLAKIYRNREQNEVIRDYAVQHLATLDEMLAGNRTKKARREKETDQKVLWKALGETGDSIAGTALLGLEHWSQADRSVNRRKLARAALQLADDDTAGELTRITACQVCARLGEKAALPVVLAAAREGETIPVRISAIGALGELGGSAQIPYLQSVLAGSEERLKPAAQHALEQINARQN